MLHKTITALFFLTPLRALAHPGHQELLETLTHLLAEPDHLAMAAIAIVIGIWGARRMMNRKTAKSR